LAIVFLMIAKPGAGESLLVLVLASIATIATSLTRRPEPSTAVQVSMNTGLIARASP
jgi:hypothetical protein